MINKYKVIWSEDFYNELERILEYLNYNLYSPITTRNFYIKILEKLSILKFFPNSHQKIILKDKTYRKLLVSKYIIIYEVNNDTRPSFYLTYFSR